MPREELVVPLASPVEDESEALCRSNLSSLQIEVASSARTVAVGAHIEAGRVSLAPTVPCCCSRKRRCCCCVLPLWTIFFITYVVLIPFIYLITHALVYPGEFMEAPDAEPYQEYCFSTFSTTCNITSFPSSSGGSIPAVHLLHDNGGDVTPVILMGGNGQNMYSTIPDMPHYLLPNSFTSTKEKVPSWEAWSVSYPGYAPRGGWTTEFGTIDDVNDLLSFVKKRTGEKVVLVGWSLGTAVVAGVAARAPESIKCVVLGNPFTNMWSMGIHYSFGALAPFFYVADHWPTEQRMSQIDVPTIVLSNKQDEMIPVSMHTSVYEAAKAKQKHLIERPGGHMAMEVFGVTEKFNDKVEPELTKYITDWCFQ